MFSKNKETQQLKGKKSSDKKVQICTRVFEQALGNLMTMYNVQIYAGFKGNLFINYGKTVPF